MRALPRPPSPLALLLLASLLSGCGGSGGGGGGGAEPLGRRFLHVTTPESTVGAAYTEVTHPDLDGDPTNLVWVTPVLDPEGFPTVPNPHPICASYSHASGKWLIVNSDTGFMRDGTAFFVTIHGKFEAFLHSATDANRTLNWTRIDDVLAGDASARLFVTQHLNAEGGTALNASEIGVYRFSGTWRIFNQDEATMPLGADFMVAVPTVRTFVHHAEAGNIVGDFTFVSHPDLPREPGVHLQVTANWNPDDAGVYNDHPIAVRFRPEEGHWTIVNTDGVAMPVGASFNVWAVP
jgi:hypothetical protein